MKNQQVSITKGRGKLKKDESFGLTGHPGRYMFCAVRPGSYKEEQVELK